MNVTEFLQHPDLMGDSFTGSSRDVMRSVLAGAFACPMDEHQRELFRSVAGDREPLTERAKELWIIAGRRAEKTKTSAGIATYLCTVWAEMSGALNKLAAGERAVVAVIATDKKQATLLLNYVRGFCQESPVLGGMIESENTEAIYFNNGTAVEVSVASIRAVRGRSMLAVVFDEVAFLRSENTAAPDKDIYRAAVPGLATLDGMVIGISSPYTESGLLFDKYKRHFGQAGPVLVVKGASRTFNPTLPQQLIDDAIADDPEAARTEWLGEFRNDIAAFIDRDTVEASTRPEPLALPYDRSHRYEAFVDPAGGGADEFCMAIGHPEQERVIVDLIEARKGTPAAIVAEYADLLKAYGVRRVTGDRYAGSWPADEFEKHGIRYDHAEKPRSELYIDALPAMRSGRVELPPDDRLINQFCNLERKTGRARDIIDHPRGGNDDRSNVAAGLIVQLASKPRPVAAPLFGRR